MKKIIFVLTLVFGMCLIFAGKGYAYSDETENLIEEKIKYMGERLSGYTMGSYSRPISQKLEQTIRTFFKIPDTSTVLYVSRKIGDFDESVIVITNTKVYYLPEKRSEGKRIFYSYLFEIFADAFYKDGYIQNIDLSNVTDAQDMPYSVKKLHLGLFSKYNDTDNNGTNVAGYIGTRGKLVAETLSSIAQVIKEEEKEEQNKLKKELDRQEVFWNKFKKIPENKQAQFLKDNFDDSNWRCHFAAALLAYKNNDFKTATEEWDKINQLEILPALFPPISDKYLELFDTSIKYEDVDADDHNSFYKDPEFWEKIMGASKLFEYRAKAEEIYLKHFFEQPYDERKLILPVKKIKAVSDKFVVLDIRNMPKGIILPPGHPQPGQFYIGDPVMPQRYIPLDDYQQELLDEKMREFVELAEALGAEDVSVERVSLKNDSNETIASQEMTAHGSYGPVSTEVSLTTEQKRALNKAAGWAKTIHAEFAPQNSAIVKPTNLPWFDYEKEWQALYKFRLNGSIQVHSTRIQSSNSVLMNDEDYAAVNADLGVYGVGIGGSFKDAQQNKYQKQESIEIVLKVTFPKKELCPCPEKQSE